ncbi:hypothetical protein PENTCL1PPCAC_28164, partial [Pristionchus entomophagus]
GFSAVIYLHLRSRRDVTHRRAHFHLYPYLLLLVLLPIIADALRLIAASRPCTADDERARDESESDQKEQQVVSEVDQTFFRRCGIDSCC